ncbi:unnamed protein product [Closterium sp. NIES-64]|nr:unnamed protein product [Closterium sp. NIES-64]
MLGSAHPAHRAVALRRPATSAVLSAVLARTTLPPPSAPVARSPSAHHAPPPCASPSQFAHRAPLLGRGDRGGPGLDVCRGLPRPRLPLRSVIREGWLLPAAWRVGSESRWRGLVMGARVAESPGAGARAAVIGESSGEGEERWRGEGVEVGGAEREVGGEGGASEQVVFDPPALPAAFEGVQRWVVFSDLHVSRRNAELCAALLTHVHQLAKDRAAGVVCLGDFWHVRGSLPVEALNAVMHAMGPAVWTQPTLMIPGNHDQVSVDGTQHALAVLERINPHIVVLSRPTVLLAALWLPFRHHAPLLSAAMHQALHAPPPSTPPIRAVFMHADVEGARRSSTEGAITLPGEGLDPLLLPPGVPVYSGHLHLPHTVAKGGHSVVYVGSCMQHSFGEAGQSKRAVVLRGGTWEHVEDIPLHVGPRHFIIPTAALASQPGEGEGESGWQAGEGWQQVVAQLRAGDLVRWEVPGGAAAKDTRDALACLRATGALVQTVASQALSRPPRILQADTLEPSRVFASYATAAHLPPPVLSAAQDLLKDLEVPPRLMHSTSAHVCLDAVHLSGFGPFLAPTTYPLAARGIVLLCGRNEVAGGAAGDSNGAGKTSLAMAALWALTGSMDARPDSRQGLRMADVVHRSGQGEGEGEGEGGEGKGRGRRRKGEGSGAGVARVRVEGRVNGKAFVVEREASRWVEREACRWVEREACRWVEREACRWVGREAPRWVGEDVVRWCLDKREKRQECGEEGQGLDCIRLTASSSTLSPLSLSQPLPFFPFFLTEPLPLCPLSLAKPLPFSPLPCLPPPVRPSCRCSRRSALRLEVEGRDQTCQEIRLTQERIDALMDTSLLSRTAELSGVVGMDVWGAARARSKDAVRALQARVGEMRGGLAARREAVKKLERMVGVDGAGRGGGRVEDAEGAFNTWEAHRAARQQRVGVQQVGAEQQLASACQRLASLVAPRLQAAVALSHSHALALHSSVLASLSGGEGEGERGTRMGGVGGGRAGRGEEEEGMEERERELMTGIASLQGELSALTAGLREQQQRLGEFEAHVGGAVGGGEVLVCDRCQQPIDPLHAEECSRQLRAEVEETQRQLAGKQQAREVLQEELVGVRGWLEARQRERRKSEERDAQARRQQQQAAMAQQEELKAVQRYTAAASQALDSLLLFLHCHSARLPATPPLPPASTPTTGPGVDGECGGAWRQEVVAAVIREAATAVADAQAAEAEVERWRREAECGQAEGNPHDGERRRLVEMLGEARGEVEAVEGEVDAGEAQLGVMKQVDAAFGLAGVQSFVLEGALWELDAHVARYLAALSGGALLLHLSPTRAAATATKAARGKKTKKASGAGKSGVADSSTDSEASSDSGGSERGEGDEEGAAEEAGNGSGGEGQVLERIDKSVRVRLASGELVPRALRQLSGGERRRVALALALAFAELAAERSGVRYDLLVLDEVFQARRCSLPPPLPLFLPSPSLCSFSCSPLYSCSSLFRPWMTQHFPAHGVHSYMFHQRFSLSCSFILPGQQHLDDEGVAAVAAVLRSLPQRTVVVVSQANSREALAEFGVVDWVVKRNDVATVELAHM